MAPPPLLMRLLDPTPTIAIATVLTLLLIPLVLHFLLFRPRGSADRPSFLLLGPSGAGKTSLLLSLTDSSPDTTHETRTSQTPLTLPASIPASLSSTSRYRSTNDPTLSHRVVFNLTDTPGHGKLRSQALERLHSPSLKGVIFVVDASAPLDEPAEYLHDVLIELKKLQEKIGVKAGVVRVLVAANKTDLFTALPAEKVKAELERQLEGVRNTKSNGIIGVGKEDEEGVELVDGEGVFTWEVFEEDNGVVVDVKGGTMNGDEWVEKLGAWIGEGL